MFHKKWKDLSYFIFLWIFIKTNLFQLFIFYHKVVMIVKMELLKKQNIYRRVVCFGLQTHLDMNIEFANCWRPFSWLIVVNLSHFGFLLRIVALSCNIAVNDWIMILPMLFQLIWRTCLRFNLHTNSLFEVVCDKDDRRYNSDIWILITYHCHATDIQKNWVYETGRIK